MNNADRKSQIHVYVTRAELEQIKRMAERETGGNLAEFARRKMLPRRAKQAKHIIVTPVSAEETQGETVTPIQALNEGDGVYRP